jgi:threonine dehydrogenase-like Zn-dependent dehydrogenase
LVAGVGFIGHAAIANLKHRGATVIALGRNQSRLEIARQLGIDAVVNPDDPDWLRQLRDLTPAGRGADIAYECSGHPDYQRKALDSLRRFGQLILMGYQRENDWTLDLDVHDDILVPARRIAGMEDLMFKHRADLRELLENPTMQQQLDTMISGDVPLTEAENVFEKILTRQHGKFYFNFNL